MKTWNGERHFFIFGGGISLGLAMGYSGAATYFANLFFPLVQGGGWLLLFVGVGVFGALVTNAMANVAAAALILPIVIPMAHTGRGGPHDSCPLPRNRHLLCHAPGDRVPAKCHCLQLPVF